MPNPASISRIVAAYEQLLTAWNGRSAADFAALFAADGNAVGFDGSQMNGRAEIAATLGAIFAHHQTASYVAKIREIRALRPDVALLRAAVGMVPPGQTELNPAVNAIQSVVFVEDDGRWQIALLHNTPAAFHGRPEMAEGLTAELTEVLRSGAVVQHA